MVISQFLAVITPFMTQIWKCQLMRCYCIPNTCNWYRDRTSHIVDRRRVRTGFTDNLQLPIVGLWRRTTIVDEGREDALPRGGLPRELSALSRISQGPILQRGRETPLRQVMMGYFLPNTSPHFQQRLRGTKTTDSCPDRFILWRHGDTHWSKKMSKRITAATFFNAAHTKHWCLPEILRYC